MLMPAPAFEAAFIERYDHPGPRYTSYPTAVQFLPDFGETQYRRVELLHWGAGTRTFISHDERYAS